MKGYVCVYNQRIVDEHDWADCEEVSSIRPELKIGEFLSRYERRFDQSETRHGRFYDWGDDPGFFAAEEFLGDVRKASWGVCRRHVREELIKGDFVIFFCAQQQEVTTTWHYYYVGVGTVREVIRDRKLIWTNDKYRGYRRFFNLLIDKTANHHEILYPHHSDWQKRLQAPYVLFGGSPQTHFNVNNPLLVATYGANGITDGSEVLESWLLDNKYVRDIHALIPQREGGKKLRTSYLGYAHQHMRLADKLNVTELRCLRQKLLELSRRLARRSR